MRVPAPLGSGESSLPGLQTAAFLPSNCVITWLFPGVCAPGGSDGESSSSSYKDTGPIGLGFHPYDFI